MKKLLFITILFISKLTFAQITMSPPYENSQNEKLSIDAYTVIKANKYLDFKDRDTLVEIINDTIYEKTDLNNYFGYKKNWTKIENENFHDYQSEDKKYHYTFQDSTMTETYDQYGGYDIRKEFKSIYNSKGFVLYSEKKVFFGNDFHESEIVINEFDNQNRVVKITNRTERPNKEENKESVITATYNDDSIQITSENGEILCQFIVDENSVGFISKLSPRETTEAFIYVLLHKNYDQAKDYCTEKMNIYLTALSTSNNQLEDLKFIEGTDTYTQDNVIINNTYELKYTLDEMKKYDVKFIVIKQKNGWKIDAFEIKE